MSKFTIVIIILVTASVLFFATYQSTDAFTLDIISTILDAVRAIADFLKSANVPQFIEPFGGKITSSGTACKLHYWVATTVLGVPVTFPGFPIPLFGTRIDVSRPGIPANDIYTFPGISQIFSNHNENQVGVWTLGLVLNESFSNNTLDKVNDALDAVPPISVGIGTLFNFSLKCPDGGIIFKIGTS